MSFEENFIYPLVLLLIGGGISGGLIPLFNSIHKQKLLEVEHERELSQKRIDRDREDYRFEMEIKEKILDKISEEHAWYLKKFKELGNVDEDKSYELTSELLDELTFRFNKSEDLIKLYFNTNELREQRSKVFKYVVESWVIPTTKPNSEIRKESLKEFQKEAKVVFESEDILNAEKNDKGLYEPVFFISKEYGILERMVLEAKASFDSFGRNKK